MQDAVGAVQSALVLGGTSEIALATMDQLVARRCETVVLACRNAEQGETAATRLQAAGATRTEVVNFDAADPTSHQATIDAAFDAVSDIDLVLLAFGVLGDQATFDADPVAGAEAVSINYAGAVSACLSVAARLRSQGHGTLVVLSSVAGERARKDNYVYGSSKAGLDAFAQGLGDSLRSDGVSVMVVRPGFVHTRMTAGMDPAPFATTPDAVAAQIVRGLERNSEIVWAPPILRWVFAVMRHLPRGIWRKVSAR